MAQRGRWTIQLKDVPNDIVIHRYLYEKTNFLKKVELFKNHKVPDYVELPISYDLDALTVSVEEAIELFGLHNFDYSDKAQTKSESYISSSLTWNPDAIDKISENPHMATLGSTMLKYGSASLYDTYGVKSSRNTYNDTFSFIQRTEFSNFKEIKKFLDTFSRTLVRSRISTIMGNQAESTKFDFAWHNDELIFVNLRVNVPIITNPNYCLQIMSQAKEEELNITEFTMQKGFGYAYDTNKYHRPLCKKLNNQDRVHMICGVSPWFDFDEESQSWISNEYYGEVHPFEMLELGLITSTIKKNG